MTLKTAWDEVTEKTILNCFRKSGISVEAQTSAIMTMMTHLKRLWMMASMTAVEELEFDLNQLCETTSDLAPENFDTDGIVDFDRDMVTNEFRPLSVDEIANEYLPQTAGTVENISSDEDEVLHELISPPSRNEVDGAIEILSRLTLFTTDSELDPLLQKVSNKTNQRRLDKMKQSLLTFF